jgi:putative ABC transport system permease protein
VQEVWSDAWFGARLLVLAAATVALGVWYGTGLRLFPLWAIVRAAIQLSIVALLLRGVLAVPWTAAAFVLLMLSTASFTAMGRTRELWRGREAAVVGSSPAPWSASRRSSCCSWWTFRRATWSRPGASSSATR